jgi:hypothetical protein
MRVHGRTTPIVVIAAAALGLSLVYRTHVASRRLAGAGGFGGPASLTGLTTEAADFQWLLRVPGAKHRFSELVQGASPGARLYGACGLYLLGSERYHSALGLLLKDDSAVTVVQGCLGSTAKVRDFALDLQRDCDALRSDRSPGVFSEVRRLTGR